MQTHKLVFVDRRKGDDRRLDADPCSNIPMDLYHRKRRKSKDRRDTNKSLSDDYYSYMQKVITSTSTPERDKQSDSA
ncbi:hypothetical protein SAMN02745866_00586 [Alteromonadaceae bacterium Bs31]|nr:hypothetical protein SAMN02745866_00586 [Alteromonadaceae bacterium Bs31]